MRPDAGAISKQPLGNERQGGAEGVYGVTFPRSAIMVRVVAEARHRTFVTHREPDTHMTTKTEVPEKVDFSAERAEWIEAFDEVVAAEWENGAEILKALRQRAREAGVALPCEMATPFRNTIPKHDEVPYPGDRNLERRIEALIRWNAMAMVHGQNKKDAGIGGHISTYSSLATLQEVGYNHFFRAKYIAADGSEQPGDLIYHQGHASPGVYARSYLLGRFDDEQLKNFRHELRETPGR